MKPVKIIYVLCLALLFINSQALNIFAQVKEPVTVRKNPTVEPPSKASAENVAALIQQTSINKPVNGDSNSNENYLIGFRDTLEILVSRHPELSQTVNVSPDGTILMPRIDQPIVAACKTEQQLREHINSLYKSHLRNPFVSVRVTEQKSQPFGVMGAVKKPGNFYLNRKMKLLELLALAEGPDVEYAGRYIQVARLGNTAGCGLQNDTVKNPEEKVQFLSYRLNDVMDGKQNPWMEPGDIVSVLISEEAYVVGNVVEPKKVSLRETVTLTTAIAMAGGLAKEAKTSKVRIQRMEKDGALQTETFYDLKDIQSKKIPDPIIQANDIVDVPNDSIKSIRNGILKAITGGIPNVFYKIP